MFEMIDQNLKKGERTHGVRLITLCMMLVFAVAIFSGCGEPKLDRDAESIVITSLSELENESFLGFDNLKTLDLRAVETDAAHVDALQAALPGCDILWNVPLGSSTIDSTLSEIILPQDCTAADLTRLRYFPALSRVDATACAVDEAFATTAAELKAVNFVWNVTFDGVFVQSTDTALDLTGLQSLSPELLGRLLPGLSALEQVVCSQTGWSVEQIAALQDAYPAIEFVYDTDVFGEQVPMNVESLDFSGKTIDLSIGSLFDVLAQLPQVTSVNLEGQLVSFEDMDSLMVAFPQIMFSFSFEMFSQQVTTQTKRLDLDGYPLISPEEVAEKLIYLPNLEYADLCDCGLTNEQMEQLMTQFPNVKFVWTIRIGAWVVRSDITAFSKGNRKKFPNGMGEFTGDGKTNFYNEDIQVLKYCTDLVYLDLGHGNRITDLTVLTNLPKLRVLILSMNKIVDLSPLAQLKQLEFLEVFQNPLTDISVVTQLPNLKYLNCGSTYIDDITPLLEMQQLEMLWFIHNRYVDAEERRQLEEALPNVRICFNADSSGGGGWTENDLYVEYQTAFGLPAAG